MINILKIVNCKLKIPAKQRGFTLVEMLIAVSLFVVVSTLSIGAILTVFDANRKAQSSKTVVDNLNLSIEDMARIVRFGNSYYCGANAVLTSVNDCSAGGNTLSVTFNGRRIIYRLNGTTIQRSDNGGGVYTNITAPETRIEYLRFYVFGTVVGDSNQPYVTAVIEGYVGNKPTSQSKFSIETVMSQRTIDINP